MSGSQVCVWWGRGWCHEERSKVTSVLPPTETGDRLVMLSKWDAVQEAGSRSHHVP